MSQMNMSEKPTFRILSFTNDKEDAEKQLKLKEAASKIEQVLAREHATKELIDRKFEQPGELNPADDNRPLYQRLLDQRMKKQEQVEEAQRLSNYVSKLDEDEVDFLRKVDDEKYRLEQEKRQEEMDVMEEHKRILERRQIDLEEAQKRLYLGNKAEDSTGIANQHITGTGSNKTESSSPSRATSRRAKLSNLIRVVPKSAAAKTATPTSFADTSAVGSDSANSEAEPVDGGRETRSSRRIVEKQQSSSDVTKPKDGVACKDVLAKPARESLKRKKNDDSDSERSDDNDDTPAKRDCCAAARSASSTKGVLKCIGILPSLPNLASQFSDSSDDSSNSSNEETEPATLLTRSTRRPKERHE